MSYMKEMCTSLLLKMNCYKINWDLLVHCSRLRNCLENRGDDSLVLGLGHWDRCWHIRSRDLRSDLGDLNGGIDGDRWRCLENRSSLRCRDRNIGRNRLNRTILAYCEPVVNSEILASGSSVDVTRSVVTSISVVVIASGMTVTVLMRRSQHFELE
jgi:hypothetical protein